MATTLIRNGAFTGALGAIMSGRANSDKVPADYATMVNAADAFATQFLAANTALTVPMADADNANIGQACQEASRAVLEGRACVSATALDYLSPANAAAAIAKQGVAKLV